MDFGIVYHIEDAPQFWAELHEILDVNSKEHLTRIDNALKTFIAFCTQYHELYLQTSLQLEHACSMLLESEIFSWHSERLSEILLNTAAKDTNPHCELIVHSVLLIYGRRNPAFLRSKAKWKAIFPILMDHVLVEMDEDFGGNVDLSRGPAQESGMGVPIEARLRSLAIGILYEACRVQKFDNDDLRIFDGQFIERLFDLVELTRNVDDESLNYSVIKLIVALSEQFMVAASSNLQTGQTAGKKKKERNHSSNRIIEVLLRRLHSSKTFGENLIFMLNRANDTEEDLVMQLLLLKILYLLFTTPGTQEYFYTNDLRVLVDVFLRELVDLPDESEALRHTYLRVLNPLLTHTQLTQFPYKGIQIRRTLQSLVAHGSIREVTPTTRRLVERCLNAEWCRSLPQEPETGVPPNMPTFMTASTIGASDVQATKSFSLSGPSGAASDEDILEPPKPAFRFMTMHKSLSAEVLQPSGAASNSAPPSPIRERNLVFSGGDFPHPSPRPTQNGSGGPPSSRAAAPATSQQSTHRPPPSIPDGAKARKKSISQGTTAEVSGSMAIHRTPLPAAGNTKSNGHAPTITSARRPSLGSAGLPRDRKPPPPVPVLDRSSLDSRPPIIGRSVIPTLPHRREPPAIPSKAKKPFSKGTLSDSPLSKLAYSTPAVAR